MSEHDVKVSQLERELRFFPVSNAHPKRLSAEQIRFYNERGYLSGFRVFDQEEVRQNRQKSDALLDRFIKEGKGSYAINRYQDRFATIYDLATAPAILDLVEDIVGPNIICWATHYFCKMPGDDMGVSWHQDCSYWALTPSKTVTVWLAIDAWVSAPVPTGWGFFRTNNATPMNTTFSLRPFPARIASGTPSTLN
jgi:non-heme Fe2+,alpha-ketoglutarate-dependent halogenase